MQSDIEFVQPLGFRSDGSPIWVYRGGAPDDGNDGDGSGDGDDDGDEHDDDEPGDDGLTAGGRRALEAERQAAKRARDEARPWRALAKELGIKSPDEIRTLLRKGDKQQPEVDPDEIASKARQEVMGVANKRIVRSEVRALAADDFADADDAARFLDLDEYDVDDDGNVNSRQIKADLKDLLARKPHLAKPSKKIDLENGPRGGRGRAPMSMDDRIRQASGRGSRR
jgi:hypothetical protein